MKKLGIALAVLIIATVPLRAAEQGEITVFAASSLTNALSDIGKAYEATAHVTVKFSFAASSILARQIEASGGADVFMAADTDWMDYLSTRGFIQTASRKNLLSNRLVLIAPANSTTSLQIAPGFALAAALGEDRLSVADPDSVPAGRYARQSLTSLGVWNGLADRLIRAENVRVALAYVARGEAPFGIVYETDARAEPKVRIIGTFPENSHLPIIYPAALLTGAKEQAAPFLTYLSATESRAVFEKYGFIVLGALP